MSRQNISQESSENEQESDQQLIPDGGLEAVVSRWHAGDDRRVNIAIGEDQYLVDGTMKIDDLGESEALDTRRIVEFAAGRLRAADTFIAPVSWQTGIVDSLSVEETVGALLAADAELDRLAEENADLRERERELRTALHEADE